MSIIVNDPSSAGAEYHKLDEVIDENAVPTPLSHHSVLLVDSTDANGRAGSGSMQRWKNHLLCFNLESIFVSVAVPCHALARVSKSLNINYNIVFLYLFILYFGNQYANFMQYYVEENTCPVKYTRFCIDYSSSVSECGKYHTELPGGKVSCVYDDITDLCIADKYECRDAKHFKKANIYIYVLEIMTILGFFCCHLIIRSQVKRQRKIKSSVCEDVPAVTCCFPCGLAQIYRETDINEDFDGDIFV